MKLHIFGVICATTAVVAAGVIAQTSDYEVAQLVHARRALMYELDDRYWMLLDVSSAKSVDFQGASAAALQMVDIMTGFVALLPPGTARGEALGSRAKPEIWTEATSFSASVESFTAEAERLAGLASKGDVEAFSAAFREFQSVCISCHALRPSLGGRFRFALDE